MSEDALGHLVRARWLDKRTGTFLSPDPAGYRDSANLYAYGAGDPINHSDPTGLAFYGFDGTWDHEGRRSDPSRDESNIYRLFLAYTGSQTHWYMRGIGNELEHGAFMQKFDGLTGYGGRTRMENMYRTLVATYNHGDHDIDIAGFSRGAAESLEFVNMIAERGIPILDKKGRPTGQKFNDVKVRSLLLFDTVGSVGIPGDSSNYDWRLYKPANLQIDVALHAIAKDENRLLFELTRPDGFTEGWFEGGHANIGGSAAQRGLGDIVLRWMVNQVNRRTGRTIFDLNKVQFFPQQDDYWHNVVDDYSWWDEDFRNPFGRGIYRTNAPRPKPAVGGAQTMMNSWPWGK